MNIDTINECTKLSLTGKITFPEVVKKLATAGVERYIVDLVGLKKLSYGINGEAYINNLNFNPTKVASEFDHKAIKNVILDIQQGKINYQVFLQRIIMAGCCHYEVYINGKKAIYFGRDGHQHIELFPF